MEGGKRKEVENEEARDREELFNIGAFSRTATSPSQTPFKAFSDFSNEQSASGGKQTFVTG
jgi:hypothetical protein